MITDSQAVVAAAQALRATFQGEPMVGEICALDAVALLETSRGDGWKGAGVGSFNMGAIQCGSQWTGNRFSYIDTHPNADGTSTPYRVDFRSYSTRLDGMIDLVRVMYMQHNRSCVREAACRQDWMGVSRAMHDTGYYEGFGATVEQRIANHNRALMRGVNRDLIALGQTQAPVVTPATIIPETVRRGDGSWNGKAGPVMELQRELGLAADGEFGDVTKTAVLSFQYVSGLTADGVVGPATWAALLGATGDAAA